MSRMTRRVIRFSVAIFIGLLALTPLTGAQDTGIEFVARVSPSGGLEEPVRGFPFFLLSKSFEDIDKEVEATDPKPEMNAFIDKQDVSPELKAWMKKNQWVALSGEDFIHKLKVDDIMKVPEFYDAYLSLNSGTRSLGFPKPKFKPTDKTKDPAKYEKLLAEYNAEIRSYIVQNPDSADGIDLDLQALDPNPKWLALEGNRKPEIRRRALDLAESKYLIARTETNLQGEGFLRNIPPGVYWLSTLDVSADVGDVRPRWDVAVKVQQNQVTYIALSNANAVQASQAAR
jgi:hypothetical protein